MSGSTIGGVVGGAVGFFVGGPAGAQWGWMIGSAVGGYVDPTRIEGPRLTDARNQTSRDGIPIPFGWGVFPVAGNVIWQQPDITEHENEQSGKGGGTEQVTYTYTRSYAIGICEGPITGLLQIKRNGKLVYDARDDATLEAEYTRFGLIGAAALERITGQRAENARFMDRCVVYLGDETQGPDPTIEGYLGVGNVPSYRGLAYIVVTDDETNAGEIAQYEFVVAACGDVTPGETAVQWLLFQEGSQHKESPDGLDWSAAAQSITLDGGELLTPGGSTEALYAGGGVLAVAAQAGVFSGRPHGFRESDGDWFPIAVTTLPAGTGQIAYSGTHWFIAAKAGGVCKVSADGKTFSDIGTQTAEAIARAGSKMVFAYATGASYDLVVFRQYDLDGTNQTVLPDLHVGYTARLAVMGSDGNRLLMALQDRTTADYQVKLHSSDDGGETWTARGTPFPDFTSLELSQSPVKIHHDPVLGWFVVAYNRIAIGPSPSALTLDAQVFPGVIHGIGSDGSKVVVCGAGGMLWAYTPTGGWVELDSGLSGELLDVVALGTSGFTPGATDVPIPDAPGYYVGNGGTVSGPAGASIAPCTPTLGEIVADLCEREGLTAAEYDVSALTDLVPGFVVARETDAASVIGALTTAYFFDPGEWDGKLRFVKRGGTSVFAINGDDLVERDGDAFERERVQEAELLRRSTIGYIDPAASYGPTTQKYERRAGTVQARGEASFEVPITMDGDAAATITKRRVLTAWGEPEKQKFSLPYRLSALTPTDIITYTDADGEVHYLRLMQAEDDSGIRYMEAATNCAEAYNATATGVAPKAPTVSDVSLRGPTRAVIMDLPLWRTGDADDIGLYGAFSGYFGGWPGAQVDISVDGGTTYGQSVQVTNVATIGYTTTALAAWSSSESPANQSVTVYLPNAPSSVTYEVLLTYANRAAVQLDSGAWEILQYQTVTALGGDLYTLSGLVRGRFNTTPGAVSANATFVLLNDAVKFVPTPRDALGETMTIRATTYGTSSDAAVPFDYDFSDGCSQTEWPVHGVEATRDGSDNVSVSCIIRDRLGTEVSRYPSVHFVGLRFSYTDGVDTFDYDVTAASIGTSSYGTHTYTDAMQTADFGSVPGSLTVTIAPLNDITGAGPASAGVTV